MTPRLTFRIGVTGHRPGDRLARGKRLAAEMAACLDAIAQAVAAFSKNIAASGIWSDAAPEIRLLSCLAEGADRIGAEAALVRQWPLEAVLPFTSHEYKKDFTSPASRAAFERLCAQAKVFSLAMPGGPDERSAAYAAAGDLLLGNCDLLIAIWDGEKGRGRGGTHWMVRRALARGLPVLHIHAANAAFAPQLIGAEPGESLETGIARVVSEVCAGPANADHLQRFYAENGPDGYRADGWFLSWRKAWSLLCKLALQASPAGHGEPHEPAPPPGAPNLCESGAIAEIVMPRAALADAVSTRLGHVYRSGFALNFLFSALAVMAGLGAVFAWQDPAIKAACVAAELGFIALIVLITQRGGAVRAWHERWLETRRLAEMLRQSRDLALVGAANTMPSRAELPWTAWYARATLRETGLPPAIADPAWLRSVLDHAIAHTIDGQIAYHRSAKVRSLGIHHGLDRIGIWLFGITVAFGLAYLAAFSLVSAAHVHDGFWYDAFKEMLKPAVTFVSAGFPALGAALYGIRAQADLETTAARSAATARALSDIRSRMLAERENPEFAAVRALLAEAAETMLGDLNDWRHIHKHRPLVIPA